MVIKVNTIVYDGKEYLVADIPDVITGSESRLSIGSHSLNIALYDDVNGFQDGTAKEIDEQIYAYIDDEYFSLEDIEFLSKVKEFLD
ncbi:hypothetical protein SAMN04487900_10670 [Prevotella communis]|uniref:Uncharacterized protein n=1 Tax=Prevotella communis TaxID=2913614 RepID=A0A1H0FSI3_9BACT|nr:hypothetical protein SAMN04487900_10670 [Prevotella communis]